MVVDVKTAAAVVTSSVYAGTFVVAMESFFVVAFRTHVVFVDAHVGAKVVFKSVAATGEVTLVALGEVEFNVNGEVVVE